MLGLWSSRQVSDHRDFITIKGCARRGMEKGLPEVSVVMESGTRVPVSPSTRTPKTQGEEGPRENVWFILLF